MNPLFRRMDLHCRNGRKTTFSGEMPVSGGERHPFIDIYQYL